MQFDTLGEDDVFHAFFSPRYLFQPTGKDRTRKRCLFDIDLEMISDDNITRSIAALVEMGRPHAAALLATRTGRQVPHQHRWESVPLQTLDGRISADTPQSLLDLCRDYDGQIEYLHQPCRNRALVLGAFHPYPPLYMRSIFNGDRPYPPSRHPSVQSGSLDRIFMILRSLERSGWHTTSPKINYRDETNVYLRTQRLIREADLIILVLEDSMLGPAIEFSMIYEHKHSREKSMVFYPDRSPLSGLLTYGAFKLPAARAFGFISTKHILETLGDYGIIDNEQGRIG